MTAMSYGMTVGTWWWTKSHDSNELWDGNRYMGLSHMTAVSYGMTVGTWWWTKSHDSNELWDDSRYMAVD